MLPLIFINFDDSSLKMNFLWSWSTYIERNCISYALLFLKQEKEYFFFAITRIAGEWCQKQSQGGYYSVSLIYYLSRVIERQLR